MLGTTKELGVGSIPHKLTTAVHGNEEKGKNYRCYQRGTQRLANCSNPVPLLPRHIDRLYFPAFSELRRGQVADGM